MQPLVSVIVPIYNVEKYLSKCVDAIINQTYNNLDIILVDDGSPDQCSKICDSYQDKDDRISVVHKKNGGLSDARNAGMKIAKGEFVCFIDSDDYISKDFIEVLYNALVNENSDIAECDVVKFDEGKEPIIDNYEDSIFSVDTEKGLSLLMAENEFHQHVWNKLYRSSIALSVEYEKGKLNEDEFWTYQIFAKAKRVSKVKKSMYFYLQRAGSIMGNIYSIKRLDALEAKVKRQAYIEKYFCNLATQAKIDLWGSCVFAGQSTLKYMNNKDKKVAFSRIKSYYKQCKLSKQETLEINDKNKYWVKISKISFYLCCKIRSVTGIGF